MEKNACVGVNCGLIFEGDGKSTSKQNQLESSATHNIVISQMEVLSLFRTTNTH